MSTVAVAKKDGYAAIGSDTLTMLGSTKETATYIQNHSKILKVGNNHIAYVGHASTGLVLTSYFSGLKKKPSLSSPEDIFEASRQLHTSLKEDYFLNPNEDEDDEFESLRINCLIANPSGIFGLYSLRSVQEYTKFYAFGSGYKFALGAMRATYEKAESAEDIVRVGLEAAADFDDQTCIPIETKTVKLKHKR